MDVKTKFLHGEFKEDMYMTQPSHHIGKGNESLVWKLKKFFIWSQIPSEKLIPKV
jgi:hypothetical protein